MEGSFSPFMGQGTGIGAPAVFIAAIQLRDRGAGPAKDPVIAGGAFVRNRSRDRPDGFAGLPKGL